LPKTSVYHILESLKKRGLVESWKKNNILYFSAGSPKRLLAEVKEKEDLLHSLIPDLTNISNQGGQDNSVKMYEGADNLKRIMWEALEYCAKHKINSMLTAATDSISSDMPRFMNDWLKEREGMNIFVKMLIPNGKMFEGFNSNALRETRYLPADFGLPSTINIYGDRVDLFSFKDGKINIVVIDSKPYTDLLRNFFLLTWQNAEKTN